RPFVDNSMSCVLLVTETKSNEINIRLRCRLDTGVIHQTEPRPRAGIGAVVSCTAEIFENRADATSIVIARPYNRLPKFWAVTVSDSLCTEKIGRAHV